MKMKQTIIVSFLIMITLCLSACGGANTEEANDVKNTSGSGGETVAFSFETNEAEAAPAVLDDDTQAEMESQPAEDASNDNESTDTDISGSAGQPDTNNGSVGQPDTDGGSRINMNIRPGSHLANRLADFTFTTYDGESFSLYETLQEKDMVLINIWATWCGPCRMEFPYMEEAYEDYKDRIEIFALSCEPDDTDEVLKDFAEELGLTFPMGRDSAGLNSAFRVNAIPTSIVIDRFGTICFIEAGSQTSADNFRRLFDSFVGDDYTESVFLSEIPPEPTEAAQTKGGVRVYTLSFKDQNGDPVKDVTVNVCDDASCTPMTSNSRGIVRFIQPGFAYHIQVVGVPDGYEYDGGDEVYLSAEGGITKIILSKQ